MPYETIQRLIYKVASKFSGKDKEKFENFVSIGNETYVKILTNGLYDESYGVAFSTFLTRCLIQAIKDEIRGGIPSHAIREQRLARREEAHSLYSDDREVSPKTEALDIRLKLEELSENVQRMLWDLEGSRGGITQRKIYHARKEYGVRGWDLESIKQHFSECL